MFLDTIEAPSATPTSEGLDSAGKPRIRERLLRKLQWSDSLKRPLRGMGLPSSLGHRDLALTVTMTGLSSLLSGLRFAPASMRRLSMALCLGPRRL